MVITGAQVVHEANRSFPNQWLLLCNVSNVLVVCTTKHRYMHYSSSTILVADLCVECIKYHLATTKYAVSVTSERSLLVCALVYEVCI